MLCLSLRFRIPFNHVDLYRQVLNASRLAHYEPRMRIYQMIRSEAQSEYASVISNGYLGATFAE